MELCDRLNIMADKLKQMHWKKILLVGGILMVALVAGLCVQKPEGIEPTPIQPSEDLKLSDFPEAFKDSTLIIVGDNASDIEMQAVNEIADYLENGTGNKPLIKKYSEITEEDKRNYNLIVVGTPKTNPLLEEVYAMTNATRVTEEFPGEDKGVLEILRNPWDESKAVLLVEGWDEIGINNITELKDSKLIVDKEFFELKVIVTFGKKPQKGALVKIQSFETQKLIAEKRTDEKGIAVFNLPRGSYYIVATYKSYFLQLSPYQGEKSVNLTSDTIVEITLRGGM